MRVITKITYIEPSRYCMMCENDSFFHVIYVMSLELLFINTF